MSVTPAILASHPDAVSDRLVARPPDEGSEPFALWNSTTGRRLS
ncbi:MAG TPA: hypothetical protein VFE65_25195 [Pseudonocardia sp.]|nr:hypothetical protein [Pseudonocardia sp.]